MSKPFTRLFALTLLLLYTEPNCYQSNAFAQSSKKLKPSLVDQGQANSALKGIATLEGFKVEIVAQNPIVVNPSSICFSEDGKAFVLERSTNFTKKLQASSWTIEGLKDGLALKTCARQIKIIHHQQNHWPLGKPYHTAGILFSFCFCCPRFFYLPC